MGRKSRVRKVLRSQEKENQRAMRGVDRLANMSDEEARAYIETLRVREARAENTGAAVRKENDWRRKRSRS